MEGRLNTMCGIVLKLQHEADWGTKMCYFMFNPNQMCKMRYPLNLMLEIRNISGSTLFFEL